jgi:hypothetical protein
VNGTELGVVFAFPTTVPLLAFVGTPLAELVATTAYVVAVTAFATAVAVSVLDQFGYATGKEVAVGIVYVGLTNVGT